MSGRVTVGGGGGSGSPGPGSMSVPGRQTDMTSGTTSPLSLRPRLTPRPIRPVLLLDPEHFLYKYYLFVPTFSRPLRRL